MSTLDIAATDGTGHFTGYLARPMGDGPFAAVLVIQEIFGVNAGMRQICDALAAQGYLAFCPDIFWRQELGVQLTDQSEAEWQKAFALFNGFDQAKGVEDLQASVAALRVHKDCSGKVAALGYCLGGRMAYLMACRTDVDCAVAFYGVGLENNLDEAAHIQKPLLMHMAALDKYVPPDAQQKIRAAVAGLPRVDLQFYIGVDHAFARPNGIHFDEAAAKRAHESTTAFLQKNLA